MPKVQYCPVILRYCADDATPILFLPADPARLGYIGSYMHVGQHGEASMGFYHTGTIGKAFSSESRAAGLELLVEYAAICELNNCKMVRRTNDTWALRQKRWRHHGY